MKNIFTILSIFLFSISISAQDYSLTVNNGTGSGSYFYGDTVHIFSDKPNALHVFSEWTGDGIEYLDIADEWHTLLVVPSGSNISNLTLQANYDQLPTDITVTMEMMSLFGEDDGIFMENVMKEVYSSIPPNPKGIVFLFHGTGGQGSSMYSRYELLSLAKDLYYAGYGTISTDANERTIGDQTGEGKIRWVANQAAQQNFDNNIDLYNIRALKDTLIARYGLENDFPFFSYGVSNGANFSDLAAAANGFRASAHNTGNGSPSLYHLREDATPVIWIQSINDQNESADSTIALANYQALLDRGICSEWHWLQRSPLYKKRFMRSRNNITQQKSLEIYNRFLEFPNLMNDEHFFVIDDILEELPSHFYDPLGLTPAQINDAESQMKVMNADHVGNGDFNKTIIRFFENTCETTATTFPIDTALHISIYPNPTSETVNIVFPKTIMDTGTSHALPLLVVSDIMGKIVFKKNISGTFVNLNLGHLTNGVYLISFQINGQIVNKKIILQK